MTLTLAWRNIWRNKRRTLITAAMIFMAVVLAVIMQSVQSGVYDRNIHNLVSLSSGYVQVAQAGHNEDKTLETSMEITPELSKKITSVEGVKGFVPRIQNVGLVASIGSSKECFIIGMDPDKEKEISKLDQRLTSGDYLTNDDQGVILGEGLAKRIEAKIGDSIVILSIGFHEQSANALLPVRGIASLSSPDLDKRMIYMTIPAAQYLFVLGNRVSDVSIELENHRDFEEVAAALKIILGDEYEALTWKELFPELAQLVEGDNASNFFILAVLYLIIAFGVFGTVLMMLAERKKEFGMVTAIGMPRKKLALIVFLENITISFLGAIGGMMGATPLVYWLKKYPVSLAGDMKEAYLKLGFEPVITADFYASAFLGNAALVFFIACLLSVYPFYKILFMKPIESLRS
ncbi:MAG: ABC-type lipoprotein release transport system permease subunit [Bacteroidia bacterium]|jgi:ABC-type lipoprotein release transport system permease subunit